MKMISKLTSRKMWLSIAAFLAAFAMGVTGIMPAEWCGACMAVSAGIYAACEAYVDGQAAKANGTQTVNTTSITATSASQKVVEKAFTSQEAGNEA